MHGHVALTVAISAGLFCAGEAVATEQCSARSGALSPPLIELYTSEGCSSCPPADRWLSAWLSRHPEAALLAFHVDYWDYIGWKDRFADSRYSARQRDRVNAAGERVVYTPQVMAGENIQINWRGGDVGKLRSLPTVATLSMVANRDSDQVSVELLAGFEPGQQAMDVMLALHSNDLGSEIRAGENRGVRLTHDRVVRRLYGPFTPKSDGSLRVEQSFSLPSERGSQPGLLAFVQQTASKVPLQTLALALDGCPPSDPADH